MSGWESHNAVVGSSDLPFPGCPTAEAERSCPTCGGFDGCRPGCDLDLLLRMLAIEETPAMSANKSRPGQQQVIVRMPADLHEAFKARADAEERSFAQAVRHAMRCYLAPATPTEENENE